MAETLLHTDDWQDPNGEPFTIGDWTIRPDTNTAERGDEVRRLEGRAVGVLAYLNSRHGEVVTKNDLLDAVWQKAEISEHSVAVVVSDLRRALGDDSRAPRYIQTIPRRGYRLIAERPADPALPDETEPTAPTPHPAMPAPRETDGAEADLPANTTPAGDAEPPAGRPRMAFALLVMVLIACAATVLILDRSRAPHPDPDAPAAVPTSRGPFTTLEERPITPHFSPDGGQVAFAWNEGGGFDFDIFVKPLGSQSRLRLTDTEHFDTVPVWSPRGNQIAFLRRDYWNEEAYCGVHIISSVGGPDRRIAPCALPGRMAVDWMPDGEWIVFSEQVGKSSVMRLSRVSERTQQIVPLTEPPIDYGGDDTVAVSPDGRHIAFRRSRARFMGDLYVLSLDEAMMPVGEPRRLTWDGHLISDIDWAPDGKSIIFSSGRRGLFRLWQIPLSGGEPVEYIRTSAYIHGAAISPDGRTVILDQRDEATNIAMTPITPPVSAPPADELPKEPVFPPVNENFILQSSRFEWHGDFSPDRKRLVFLSDRSGAMEVWTINADGRNDRQITSLQGPVLDAPKWSPTSNSIVFTVSRDANMDIYTVSPEGGEVRRHTSHPALDSDPIWSPDGASVYFLSDRTGRTEVWALDIVTGAVSQITTEGAAFLQPSNDPAYIFVAIPGESGIWRVATDGSGRHERAIEKLPDYTRGPWRIVGDHVYFIARKGPDEPLTIRRRPIGRAMDSGAEEIVAAMSGAGIFQGDFAVSRDHEAILFSQLTRYRGQLYRIDLAGPAPAD